MVRTWIWAGAAVVCLAAPIAKAFDDIGVLVPVLQGRAGDASEDRRKPIMQAGVKIGCKGDTLAAKVTLSDVKGTQAGNIANMTVRYAGTYERQGWDIPCQKVSSNLHGLEKKNVSGTYTFQIKREGFLPPTIIWGKATNLGEATTPEHDSNVMAVRAVQDAISDTFRTR